MTRLGHGSLPLRLISTVKLLLSPAPRTGRDSSRPILVLGHRGAARECPENTISSFVRALDLGADGVEADICSTRDGRFVLWHDADPDEKVALARQVGAESLFSVPDVPGLGSPWRRKVAELDLADLKEHYGYGPRQSLARDLLDGDSRPAIPIDTLEDLFEFARGESRLRHVCLDVKLAADQTESAAALARLVREFCSAGSSRTAFHLLSPQREIARVFLRELPPGSRPPSLDVYPDFELPGALEFTRRLESRLVSMGCGERFWTPFRREVARVIRARERGRIDSVIVWTVNGREKLTDLVVLGVDGMITDDIALLREILRAERDGAGSSTSRGAPRRETRSGLPRQAPRRAEAGPAASPGGSGTRRLP